MVDKNRQNDAFYSLDKPRQKAVVMLFEDEMTDEKIAKAVNRSRATLSKWKQQAEFKDELREYRRIALDDYVPDAIKQLHNLSTKAKSEMVRMQASTSIIGLSGFGNVDDNPHIEAAKIRKLEAEADIAEAKAKMMAEGDNSAETEIIIGEYEDE